MNDIRLITQSEEYKDFIKDRGDNIQECLDIAIEKPGNHFILGVYTDDRMTGVFSFLCIIEEKYLEMTSCLSEDRMAYQMVFEYLKKNYKGFKIDFAFNPVNHLLKEQLLTVNAELLPESQKMRLIDPVIDVDTSDIIPISDDYIGQYLSIHTEDGYWTGEKILREKGQFISFIALDNDRVVGYVDLTRCYDENEPWGLYVLEEHRRMGFGRKLMGKAIEYNSPKPMTLDVLVDNAPAIKLYESLGFVKEEGQNTLVAHWNVK